ncbi:MAG: hypothetical protein ABIH28_03675 [archaeon]
MGIYKWMMESFLGPIAATADMQRFGKWKKELEDALEKLEKKKIRISKKEYTKQKNILQKKLKKAEELLKKSQERMKNFTHKEVRL